MLTSALYYPWMHFQDDNWVKLALLTWDSVARVRPRGVDDRDSELVRRVKNETNLLKEISPSKLDLVEVAAGFDDIFEAVGDRVVERYGQDRNGQRADFDRLAWVYCGRESKIRDVLRDDFVRRGLGRAAGSWLGMHPKLASIYLATLADSIARHNRISPVTDDTRMHHAAGALDRLVELLFDELPAPALHDPENAFVHVALQAVIKPDRLADVPVDKLIRFRDRYAAELTAFRAHVTGLGEELREIAKVENLDIARAHLESLYRTRTKPQLDELRRALRGLGVESAAGTLGLKIDLNAAAGTVIGSVVAAGGQLAVAGAAVAVTVVPYLAGRVKARRAAKTSSPVAYLLAADRKLSRSGQK